MSELINETTAKEAVRLLGEYANWLRVWESPFVLRITCQGSDKDVSVVVGYEGTESISRHIKTEAKIIADNLAIKLKEMGFKP